MSKVDSVKVLPDVTACEEVKEPVASSRLFSVSWIA
jgi:hypothetical protein